PKALHSPSHPPMLNARDEAITELSQRGWSQHRIARALHLSQPGIHKALRRLRRTSGTQPPAAEPPAVAVQGDNHDSATPHKRTPGVRLDVVLLGALHAGVCFSFQQGRVMIEIPSQLDDTLKQALSEYSEKIVRLIENASADRFPCGK